MKKRMLITMGCLALFIAIITIVKVTQIQGAIKQASKMGMPPSGVTTAIAKKEQWSPTLSAVGSLRAVNGVTISTDLAGIVSRIAFQSGSVVKKGQLLVKLDTKQEDAQLRSAKARRDMTKVNFERHELLVKDGAVSKSAFETAQTEYQQADAMVEEINALIARKTIVAPFDGLLGVRQIDLGQFLEVGAAIVRLESVDPIYINFSLPQQNMDQVKIGKNLRLKTLGVDGEFEGKISAMDSRVDESTRNIAVQGTVKNPNRRLRAGMFVNVELLLPELETLSIPASAVSYAPYGDSVFIVKDGKVQQQFVKLGQTRGDQVAVVSGIKEGDEIVSSGVFKLQSGSPVVVDNSIQPDNKANPTPPNL